MEKKIKRKEALQLITNYYKSINRDKIPDLTLYSLHDLRKVLLMFNLNEK